jgi:chromate transporter
MLLGLFLTYFFFRTPWIIPILFVIASLISNISLHNLPNPEQPRIKKKVQPIFFILFIFIFLILGFLSENARKQQWENRKLYNVGENFFRFGSIVFGGGDVLLPIIIDQYVARPTNEKIIIKNPGIIKIDKQYLLTGYGLVKAIPGPVFSYAAFTGGLALQNEGNNKQVFASFIAAIAIFLPSILLVLFFYPLWNELKKYVIFYRSILGINAVIVGVMFAAFFYLMNDFVALQIHSQLIFYLIISATFFVLKFTKIPPTFIVFTIILLGIIF